MFTHCAGANAAQAEASPAIERQRVAMTLSGVGTAPNVRDPSFTRQDRLTAQRASDSAAEYQTEVPVKTGDYSKKPFYVYFRILHAYTIIYLKYRVYCSGVAAAGGATQPAAAIRVRGRRPRQLFLKKLYTEFCNNDEAR